MTPTTGAAGDMDLPDELSRGVDFLLDRKAEDVVLLNLTGLSGATDYFLVASGRSDTHVTSIAEHLIEGLKRHGARPSGVEGLGGGRWVLVDYIDWVVHVFHPEARAFYRIEELWGDAPAHTLVAES